MFTIKYRYFQLASQQSGDGHNFYEQCESVHGPFEVVSQGRENCYITVTGVPAPECELPMTFGPFTDPGPSVVSDKAHPRPTIWVMNESGATVARYDL